MPKEIWNIGGSIEGKTELLIAATRSTSDGIVIADARSSDMPVIYVNPAFERITGYRPDEVIGRNCRFLRGSETDSSQLERLRHALKNGEECKITLQNHRKDGTAFWNELHIAPIFDNGTLTHFVGIQTDVTRRVEAERRSRELLAELEEHNTHLSELVQEKVREISDLQMATIFALARLAESRDRDTGEHIERVQQFCMLLADTLREREPFNRQIDTDFVVNIYHASPLHDIGKVGIRDAILLKKGPLDKTEYEEMKQHVLIGAHTLEAVHRRYPQNKFIRMGIEIARSHHEKWNGMGYPDGLIGEAIPLSARIMALADVYDAIRSARCYKEAIAHDETRSIISGLRGTHFDPGLVDAFMDVNEIFREMRDQIL